MAITLLFTTLIATLIFINVINSLQTWLLKNDDDISSINTLIRTLTLTSLSILFGFLILVWKFEVLSAYGHQAFGLAFGGLFSMSSNLGLILTVMSVFILMLVVLYLWYSSMSAIFICNMVLIIATAIVGAFTANNIFVFLIFFELSSLPIFVLLSYSGSMRRERVKALYYFLFFTLYGSLSLLLVLISLYSLMSDQQTMFLYDERVFWVLIFLAFAIKLPLFPFHIWLPYAHVEASTITSVILAALLLKLGGYGMVKFMLPMFLINTHLFFRPLVLVLCLIGLIYGSLCALRQIDLKRQIAFLSVAHMNFAALGIFSLTAIGVNGAVYMMVSHGLISSLYFFLVGMLAERYHSRSILSFSGLWEVMPIYSAFVLFVILANVGFPGLSGFIPEFMILEGAISTISPTTYFILLGMVITTVAGLISGLRLLFGAVKIAYSDGNFVDLTYVEFNVALILSVSVVVLGLYNILI